jgi:hypothetical protein
MGIAPPNCDSNSQYGYTLATTYGHDPEPYDLAQTPRDIVVQLTAKSLAVVNEGDMQGNLWHDQGANYLTSNDVPSYLALDPDISNNYVNTFRWYYSLTSGGSYFVSAMPNGTTTGILREHAMRLNSTAQCNIISESAFPSTCSGSHPFETSFRSDFLRIDICAPGDYTGLTDPPWTLSRDRQDIQEQLYIKVNPTYNASIAWAPWLPSNFITQCSANTTRGYFELGNIRNNLVPGQLIEKWPDNDTMWNQYNDYTAIGISNVSVASTIDTYFNSDESPDFMEGLDPFFTSNLATPGPLMTSVLAMFGNESFFYVANNYTNYLDTSRQICQAGNIPFVRLSDGLSLKGEVSALCTQIISGTPDNSSLENFLYNWFILFNFTDVDTDNYAKEALEVAMFKANEAWLEETASQGPFARNIYTSPGSPVVRPSKTVAGTVIVSVLLSLQITGLLILAWYIYTVPTWTTAFDSIAVAQLAKSIDDDYIPPIGYPDGETMEKLKDVDGLVGIAGKDFDVVSSTSEMLEAAEDSRHRNTVRTITGSMQNEEATIGISSIGGVARLARGGPGLITRAHAATPTKRGWWHRRRTHEPLYSPD